MGSDNRGKKSLNWKAAKCALHCNNCVTLLLGILLLVFGLVNYHHAQRTAIKYRLCNDVMFQNMMQTNIIVKQMPGLLSNETIKKLCHPDSQDHCTRHSDCRPGYYCDEDYNCWDCDFVLKKEEDCDGFDGHCDKCLRAPASTISKDTTVVRHRLWLACSTASVAKFIGVQVVDTAAPDAAKFIGIAVRHGLQLQSLWRTPTAAVS